MVKVHTQDHTATISEVVRIPTPACQARVCALSTILLENVTKSYRVPGKWTFKHKFAYNLKWRGMLASMKLNPLIPKTDT